MMLSLFEGKEIDFLVTEPQKPDRVIKGRVVRSGYTGHDLKKTGPRQQGWQVSRRSPLLK